MSHAIDAEILYRGRVISTVAFEALPRIGEYLAGLDDGFYIVKNVRHILVDDGPAQVQILVADADDAVRQEILGD